jgi:hypothetical protein
LPSGLASRCGRRQTRCARPCGLRRKSPPASTHGDVRLVPACR